MEKTKLVKRFSGRLRLLLCLVPLLALCYSLCGIPLTNSQGYSPTLWALNSERTVAYFTIGSSIGPPVLPGIKQWEQKIGIDLATGNMTRLSNDQYIASNVPEMQIATRAVTGLDSLDSVWASQFKNWQVLDLDASTQKFKAGKRFEFPVQGQLVGDRFFVGVDGSQVLSLDLEDPNATIHRCQLPSPTTKSFLSKVPHSQNFVVIQDFLPAGFAVNPKTVPKQIAFFELDASGTPAMLNSWPLEVGHRDRPGPWSYAIVGDEIVTLESNSNCIEFHRLKDGALSHTEPLPTGFDISSSSTSKNLELDWELKFQQLFFELPTRTSVFDCKTRIWYADLEAKCLPIDKIENENLLLLVSSGESDPYSYKIEIYDCSLQKRIGSFASGKARIYKLIDRETVAAVGAIDGYSVEVINARTGEVIQEWRPLRWVVPATAILLIVYAAWAIAWMIVAAREGGRAWMDAALIGGLFVGALTMRLLMNGGPPNFLRMPFWFGMGFFIAALMVAELYLVLGKTRLPLLIAPVLIVLAALFAILSLTLEKDPQWAWRGLVTMSLPLGITLGIALLLRLCRFQLANINDAVDKRPSTESDNAALQSKALRLSDLFLVLTSIAMLVAAARPILGSWGLAWKALVFYYETFAVVLLCLLLGVCVFTQRPWIFAVGCLLVGASFIYLPSPCLMEFASQGSGYALRWASRSWCFEVMLTCAVSFFIFCLPFRLRGWRIPIKRN